MKPEHKKIIARAHEMDLPPSELSAELVGHDLINACLKELRDLPDVWRKLSEAQQNTVIMRLNDTVTEAVKGAVKIIAARKSVAIPVTLKQLNITTGIKIVASVEKDSPHKHDLMDSEGKLCLLVLTPSDYNQGNDLITGDADQLELPGTVEKEDAGEGTPTDAAAALESVTADPDQIDPLYEQAKRFVIDSGSASSSALKLHLRIGHNRASRLLESLEAEGVVSAPTSGRRDVIHGAYVAPDAANEALLEPEPEPA